MIILFTLISLIHIFKIFHQKAYFSLLYTQSIYTFSFLLRIILPEVISSSDKIYDSRELHGQNLMRRNTTCRSNVIPPTEVREKGTVIMQREKKRAPVPIVIPPAFVEAAAGAEDVCRAKVDRVKIFFSARDDVENSPELTTARRG